MESTDTEYRDKNGTAYKQISSSDSVEEFKVGGRTVLNVRPELLKVLARHAMIDVQHLASTSHLVQIRKMIDDPEASSNERYVGESYLKNASIAAERTFPLCQDTGTAIIIGWRGQHVWTDGKDEEALSEGVREAFVNQSWRYSQVAPLDMYNEVDTGDNLPAQIDLYAAESDEYRFLFIAKGGGSANKTALFQASPSVLDPDHLLPFLEEKIRAIGTHACPPYHLAIVVGGSSAETNLKTVKLASCRYLDDLPTSGDKTGRAFRDLEMEAKILTMTQDFGLGAQFGGKYFCHDVRVVRLSRHGGSLPIGIGVSCNADRQVKAIISSSGVFLEKLDSNPQRFLSENDNDQQSAGNVDIDLNLPMREILAELRKHPIGTRLALNGPIIVARDAVHRALRPNLDRGDPIPAYMRDHPIFYSGPAKTPEGAASGSFGPTSAYRMDPFMDRFMENGACMVTLSKGNRTAAMRDVYKRHGGFYLSTVGGAAALLGSEFIKKVELVDFEEFGMEAVRKITVENFPAFIAINHKGEDFYEELTR